MLGSELCRNRDKLNKPPRLGRPEVEVDVRVESGSVGVGGTSSSATLCKEPMVDDRPRASSLGGRPTTESDWPDRADAVELLRKRVEPGAAKPTDDLAKVAFDNDALFIGLGLGVS